MNLRDFAANSVLAVLHSQFVIRNRFPDFDSQLLEIINAVKRYTMTTPERIASLCEAARHVDKNGIPGAFVECGVYRGGSSMAAAMSFTNRRDLYLFDTFEGMSAPTSNDHRLRDGKQANGLLITSDISSKIWCRSGLDEVQENMAKTGYPSELIHYSKGLVEQTIPKQAPEKIALLRLDTDWYESTKHELEHLYPRLSPGGILIIDDYGCWAGARKAVDEYFSGKNIFFHRIDAEARLIVKPL